MYSHNNDQKKDFDEDSVSKSTYQFFQ
jgi:hypothetical protein